MTAADLLEMPAFKKQAKGAILKSASPYDGNAEYIVTAFTTNLKTFTDTMDAMVLVMEASGDYFRGLTQRRVHWAILNLPTRLEPPPRPVHGEPLPQPYEVLLVAAKILRKCGWIQGTSELPEGVCAGQAIVLAIEETGGGAELTQQVNAIVRRSFAGDGIVGFNDTKGRTQGQVIEALERAAYGLD